MQARFAELEAKKAEIHAKADPIRAQRDEMVKAHEAARAVLDAQLAEAQKGLGEIDDERGLLAKVLGGYSIG
jgi:hypothetical protein